MFGSVRGTIKQSIAIKNRIKLTDHVSKQNDYDSPGVSNASYRYEELEDRRLIRSATT